MKTKIDANKCNKCGKVWITRKDNANDEPVVCPKCKSPYWNKDKLWLNQQDDQGNVKRVKVKENAKN